MAFQHKEGWGSLTKNPQHEDGDNRPEFKGDGMVNGVVCNIAVWPGKPDKNGELRYSVKVETKKQQGAAQAGGGQEPAPAGRRMVDDDIPW